MTFDSSSSFRYAASKASASSSSLVFSTFAFGSSFFEPKADFYLISVGWLAILADFFA